MEDIYYVVLSLIGVALLSWLIFWPSKAPVVAEYYKQKGKWYYLKYCVFFIIVYIRKLRQKRDPPAVAENAGYGVKSKLDVNEMDKAQPLPKDEPLAVDAVYFSGGNEKGQYFVANTARRPNGVTETALYIQLPGVGLLELATMPFTACTAEEDEGFAAAGLTIKPVKAMKQWTLDFDGDMRVTETDRIATVKFSLKWTAATPHFDFDTDMDLRALSGACAREDWSREFFNSLKSAHQTHYEQFGKLEGSIYVTGIMVGELEMHALRDHSYGNRRDWKELHRYCIQYCWLDDGTAIAVGLICFPRTFSRLPMGYVIHPNKPAVPVSSVSLEFTHYGDDGNPPDGFEFDFVAGGKSYHLTSHVICSPEFFIGNDKDARIHERMSVYRVNGVRGYGISEWEYRNIPRHSLKKKE